MCREEEIKRKWYPTLRKLSRLGLHVYAFDPGVSGKWRGRNVELGRNEVEFVISSLPKGEDTDEDLLQEFESEKRNDRKFWDRHKKLPSKTQSILQFILAASGKNEDKAHFVSQKALDSILHYLGVSKKQSSVYLNTLIKGKFLCKSEIKKGSVKGYEIPEVVYEYLTNR
jgi:hypothetical protein